MTNVTIKAKENGPLIVEVEHNIYSIKIAGLNGLACLAFPLGS